MSGSALQILVLLGIAVFLFLRLRSVLGTRDGFEKPRETPAPAPRRPELSVIEGSTDYDIADNVSEDSPAAKAFAQMKRTEPAFSVGEFISGARQAYEWIFMAFERGDLEEIQEFLGADVYEAFEAVVAERNAQGLVIEAEFIGMRDTKIKRAVFDPDTHEARISVSFEAELNSVVKDKANNVVEGRKDEVRRQRDVWVFSRIMGSDDPNWILVATDD